MTLAFRKRLSLSKRIEHSKYLRDTYKESVPFICEFDENEISQFNLGEKKELKFIVDKHSNYSRVIMTLRKQLKIRSEDALFTFIRGTIPPVSMSILEIDNLFQEDDGFVYISVKKESTFGHINY